MNNISYENLSVSSIAVRLQDALSRLIKRCGLLSVASCDIAVIGAGASGMVAAGFAAAGGARVILLDKNAQSGIKLAITGKGRCNLTNDCDIPGLIANVPRNGRFLYSAFSVFPPRAVMDFLRLWACLSKSSGAKGFPASDRARTLWRRSGAGQTALNSCAHAPPGADQSGGVACARLRRHKRPRSYWPPAGCPIPKRQPATAIKWPPRSAYNRPALFGGHGVGRGLSSRACRPYAQKRRRGVFRKGQKRLQRLRRALFSAGHIGPVVISASAHIEGECAAVLGLKPALDFQT